MLRHGEPQDVSATDRMTVDKEGKQGFSFGGGRWTVRQQVGGGEREGDNVTDSGHVECEIPFGPPSGAFQQTKRAEP